MTLTLWASMVVAGFITISWLSISSSLVITITTITTITRIASITSSQTLSAPVDRTIATITIARFSVSRSLSITMASMNVVPIAVGFRTLISIVSLVNIDISRSITSISWLSISLVVTTISSIAMVTLDSLGASVVVAMTTITITRFSLSFVVTTIAMVALDSLGASMVVAISSIPIARVSNSKGEERKNCQNNCHGCCTKLSQTAMYLPM